MLGRYDRSASEASFVDPRPGRSGLPTDLVYRTKCPGESLPLLRVHKDSSVVEIADVTTDTRLLADWKKTTFHDRHLKQKWQT